MVKIVMVMVVVMATASGMAQDANRQDSIAAEWGDTLQLKDVEVVTMRQLVKTLDDRVSYNVQADPEARTSTVLDVLRRVPLVSVDGQDNVRVNGSGSFKIYKNGHPDPALSSNPKEVLRAHPEHRHCRGHTHRGCQRHSVGLDKHLRFTQCECLRRCPGG